MAVNFHMYGYPTIGDELDHYRLKLLGNVLNRGAATLMGVLRRGDNVGRIAISQETFNTTENFEELREEYECKLSEYTEIPPNIIKLNQNPAIAITLVGYSGVSKSYRANELKKWMWQVHGLRIDNDICYINGDWLIVDVVENFMNREGLRNEGVYEIYTQHKSVLSPEVNEKIKQTLKSAALVGKVCIVDTMACLSPNSKKILFSGVPPNTIKLDIYATRFPDTFTESETQARIGKSVQDQRAINNEGDDEATKRNHFDPIGPLIPWFFLESVTENRNCLDLKQDNNERVKQDQKTTTTTNFYQNDQQQTQTSLHCSSWSQAKLDVRSCTFTVGQPTQGSQRVSGT